MSVERLAGFLRGLRSDVAGRARFINGKVVELHPDGLHAAVDVGRPVVASISPWLVSAITAGQAVRVYVQDSQYVILDAPQADGRLLSTAEIAALQALLPPTNLIPNPLPTIDTVVYNAGGATFAAIGWSYDNAAPEPGYEGYEYNGDQSAAMGPDGISPWCMRRTVDPFAADWASPWSMRQFPVDADLTLSGGTYDLSAHVAYTLVATPSTPPSARLGILGSGGVTYGSTVSLSSVAETWTAYNTVGGSPASWTALPSGGSYGGEATAHLTATLTCDGATGRPFVEILTPAGWPGTAGADAGTWYSSAWGMA